MKKVLIAPQKYIQGRGVLGELGDYLKLLGKKPLVLWDPVVKQLGGRDGASRACSRPGWRWWRSILPAKPRRPSGRASARLPRSRAPTWRWASAAAKCWMWPKPWPWTTTSAWSPARRSPRTIRRPVPPRCGTTTTTTSWVSIAGRSIRTSCWSTRRWSPTARCGRLWRAWAMRCRRGSRREAAFKSRAMNIAGGRPTMAAMTLARLCFETLLEHGLDAKRDVEHHVVTPAVEKVVEANVLLSGLGFESGGLATAHMIGNLLSNVPECQQAGTDARREGRVRHRHAAVPG